MRIDARELELPAICLCSVADKKVTNSPCLNIYESGFYLKLIKELFYTDRLTIINPDNDMSQFINNELSQRMLV